MIRLAHGAATDVGRVRSLNEDSLLVSDTLFAVADGMGGHRGGEVASATALATMRTASPGPDIEALASAVRQANAAVFEQSQHDPDLAGMGTTVCAIALLNGDDGAPAIGIVNVGDSRVYLLDGDRFAQLSEDHSLVETMVRGGQISADEALVHPGRNVLTRALGIEPQVEVDCWTVAIKGGDRFLLCSDGLFNELSDDEIAGILGRDSDPDVAAHDLVRLARDAGGRDNITAVVVDVVTPDGDTTDAEIDDRLTRVSEEHDDLGDLDEVEESTSEVPTIPIVTPAPEGPPAVVTPVIHRGERQRRRLTWRTALFLLAILAVVAVAFGAVVYAARSTYFVRLDGGQVAIFQGRPNGLLWFDPTRVENTGIKEKEVPAQFLAALQAGHQVDSRGEAEKYVRNIKRVMGTTPTTTVPTTTTAPSAATTTTATPATTTPTTAPPGP